MRIEVEIQNGINPTTDLECVKQVIEAGKISRGGKGKPYYCWGGSLFSLTKDWLWYTLVTTGRIIVF